MAEGCRFKTSAARRRLAEGAEGDAAAQETLAKMTCLLNSQPFLTSLRFPLRGVAGGGEGRGGSAGRRSRTSMATTWSP